MAGTVEDWGPAAVRTLLALCCQPYTLLFSFMFLVVNLAFKIEPEVSGPQLIFRESELELRDLESRSDSGREGD